MMTCPRHEYEETEKADDHPLGIKDGLTDVHESDKRGYRKLKGEM